MTKHYIRKNVNNDIIKIYSDKFEQFQSGDICINENAPRHIPDNLKNIKTYDGYYKFKWYNNQIVAKTNDEIYTSAVLAEIAEKNKQASIKDKKNNLDVYNLIKVLIAKNRIDLDDLSSTNQTLVNEIDALLS